MSAKITGGCLCGGVRYEIRGPFLRAGHCHCSRCRRHSGAAVCTQGRVRQDEFSLVSGTDLVRVFRPVDGSVKAFCSICGSSLFGGTWPAGPEVSIRLGTVDGDPGIRPTTAHSPSGMGNRARSMTTRAIAPASWRRSWPIETEVHR